MFKFLKHRAFKKELKRAAADGVVTAAEAQALEAMDVDQEFADKARSEQYQKAIAPIMKEIKKSLRISAQQEAQLLGVLPSNARCDTGYGVKGRPDLQRLSTRLG
jgi:hypothetical protein